MRSKELNKARLTKDGFREHSAFNRILTQQLPVNITSTLNTLYKDWFQFDQLQVLMPIGFRENNYYQTITDVNCATRITGLENPRLVMMDVDGWDGWDGTITAYADMRIEAIPETAMPDDERRVAAYLQFD